MALLWQIFFLFMRVAFFSWGGGPASLGLMQRETVSAGWMTPDEFADAVAFGNALPGPTAPQVSAFVGYKLAGLPGAISAATGTVLPVTIVALALLAYFYSIKDSPTVKAILTAVRPVIVGLLAWTAYDIGATIFKINKLGWGAAISQGWDKLLIAVASFLLLTFTSINPIVIIIVAGVLGVLFYR